MIHQIFESDLSSTPYYSLQISELKKFSFHLQVTSMMMSKRLDSLCKAVERTWTGLYIKQLSVPAAPLKIHLSGYYKDPSHDQVATERACSSQTAVVWTGQCLTKFDVFI